MDVCVCVCVRMFSNYDLVVLLLRPRFSFIHVHIPMHPNTHIACCLDLCVYMCVCLCVRLCLYPVLFRMLNNYEHVTCPTRCENNNNHTSCTSDENDDVDGDDDNNDKYKTFCESKNAKNRNILWISVFFGYEWRNRDYKCLLKVLEPCQMYCKILFLWKRKSDFLPE